MKDILEKIYNDGDDIFEKDFDDDKDILKEVFDDGDDIFESIYDDAKDILQKSVSKVFQGCFKGVQN